MALIDLNLSTKKQQKISWVKLALSFQFSAASNSATTAQARDTACESSVLNSSSAG